jgi:hypothetical protein
MFCHKCGNKIDEGTAFCHKCGAKITEVVTTPSDIIESTPPLGTLDRPGIIYMSFVVSAISIILFFFPWFKVAGQNIFAFLGYGRKNGFNLISFYLMLNKFMNYANFTFGAKVGVIIIALIVGAGAPFLGLLSHLLNCFNTLTTHKINTHKINVGSIITGPLWFIIGYYILKYATVAYVSSVSSSEWLGELVSMLFGNVVSMTKIPWILLVLGIINSFLDVIWKKPESKEPTVS